MEKALPAIPAKRYFTIGEVSELCGVKPYVLRYWEQEFTQLKPMKRRGNRRYYQHHEVLLIRRIRELLYEQGFTISGARNRLAEMGGHAKAESLAPALELAASVAPSAGVDVEELVAEEVVVAESLGEVGVGQGGNGLLAPVDAPATAAVVVSAASAVEPPSATAATARTPYTVHQVRQELISIRTLLAI
ncbi:transcriptional regulator, MerR family [Caldimonas brevitalea]|uniref:Transcriptional regulator, MerR family n=1 Tax=Caldimonas brevitalea TaxID=413882 RepID=A0A0G3BNU5_9BURK|nr:transcriptional regulator, MerR family [Caldimonas brevitalea]